MRAAFVAWLHERLRGYYGLCTICGRPKAGADAVACPDCLRDIAAIDAELNAPLPPDYPEAPIDGRD